MEALSTLLGHCEGNLWSPVDVPLENPVMLTFDNFFDVCLNKSLNKYSRVWQMRLNTHVTSLWCVFFTQVYVYAQTVVIDESINVHFALLVYTRQLIIDRSYALTIDVSGHPDGNDCV